MSLRDAQRAYDAREPDEVPVVVRVSSSTTLGELEQLVSDHGIVRLALALRGPRLTASAETYEADGDGCAPVQRNGALAEAIQDAINATLQAQREIDAAVGS